MLPTALHRSASSLHFDRGRQSDEGEHYSIAVDSACTEATHLSIRGLGRRCACCAFMWNHDLNPALETMASIKDADAEFEIQLQLSLVLGACRFY